MTTAPLIWGRRSARHICACSAVFATIGGLSACGGGGTSADPVVARVGASSITAATLAHWMSVLAPQHVVPDPPRYQACIARLKATRQARSDQAGMTAECRRQHQALTQRALGFLITADWLIEESAHRGLKVAAQEVQQRLDQRKRSFPNGEPEFRESLKATDHTAADLELELKAQLASARLHQSVARTDPKLSEGTLAAYYRRNIGRYRISERRHIYLVENLKSAAAAKRLIQEVAHGTSLRETSFHESFQRREIPEYQGEKRTILEAIFAAKPHVIAKPVELNHLYFVFEVTQVTPAHLLSFSQVRPSLAKRLGAEQGRRTLAAFVEEWRRTWVAKTDCSTGYLMQKCSQYKGPVTPEDPLALE